MSIELNNDDKIKLINSKIDFWNKILTAKDRDLEGLQKINHQEKIDVLLINIEDIQLKINALEHVKSELTNQPN